ncbi:MAG TPA: ribosome recycling factor [Gammaproteobacteria bacterium]|nr:ribosome recycling factor [Gammaproteobacteria bacterium]
MINDIVTDATSRMVKSVESLRTELSKIRTGRAHPSLMDHVMVPYYGSEVPLSQVSNINVSEARVLSIVPWEKDMVPVVEKAIMTSDLGLTPSTAGQNIRVVLPPLTEERRRELIKVVRAEAEAARVAIRNIRRDANNHVKELQKSKEISQDDERRAEEDIQKLTDKYIADVDKHLTAKEEEMMEV